MTCCAGVAEDRRTDQRTQNRVRIVKPLYVIALNYSKFEAIKAKHRNHVNDGEMSNYKLESNGKSRIPFTENECLSLKSIFLKSIFL